MTSPEPISRSPLSVDAGPDAIVERLFAASPHAHAAWLGLRAVTQGGALDAPTRRRIGLALAARCGSVETLAAHAAAARAAGLTGDEIAANQAGTSQDARAARAVQVACRLIDENARLSRRELGRLRAAGYGDAEVAELVAHAGLARLEALSRHVALDDAGDVP